MLRNRHSLNDRFIHILPTNWKKDGHVQTLEERAHFPDCNWPFVAELAGAHLKEEDGKSHEDERDDVRDEECT